MVTARGSAFASKRTRTTSKCPCQKGRGKKREKEEEVLPAFIVGRWEARNLSYICTMETRIFPEHYDATPRSARPLWSPPSLIKQGYLLLQLLELESCRLLGSSLTEEGSYLGLVLFALL